MAGEIVLGYDGSEGAKAALPEAVAAAKAYGAPLVVAFGYAPPRAGGEVQDLAKAVKELGERMTSEAAAAVNAIDAGVTVEAIVIDDRPAESLIDVAEERGARMIVVGSTGDGPIKGVIIGSVPYKLVHRSTVPVLVVPLSE